MGCRLHAPGAENNFDEGSFGLRKILSQGHQTRYMCTPWQGLLGAVLSNGVGCIVHVQCTCKYFTPAFVFPPLQAKRWAPLMPNLQVTCMLTQPICFCGYPFYGVQTARAWAGKVYLNGVLRFKEILSYRHQIWYTDAVR